MSFGSPYLLLSLAAIPLVAAVAVLSERRRAKHAVAFTNLDLLASLGTPPLRRRRFVPLAALVVALASAGVAVARPREVTVSRAPRATIVLLVDTSGSMASTDVAPSRLGAAEHAVALFLRHLPRSYDVGLVAFNSYPQVLVKPTTDRSLLTENMALLNADSGTAIGDGLASAVALITKSDPGSARVSRAIILLSDGAQTDGSLSPLQGAGLARRADVRVDTIALGTDRSMPNPSGVGGPGPLSNTLVGSLLPPAPPDPRMLAEISARSDGETFVATSAGRLDRTYARLGTRLLVMRTSREISSWFAALAAAALFAALAASWALRARLP